jgi:ribosomal subunit interface protein
MDIVVKGRNVAVPEHYRVHVEEKMARLERYDHREFRFEVELRHEPNPRQSKSCQVVEVTGKSRGPTVRAQACAGDFYAALDGAVSKLENRLRRTHDRRKVHHGKHSPAPVSVAASSEPPQAVPGIAAVDGHADGRFAATAVLEEEREDEDAVASGIPEQRWEELDDTYGGQLADGENMPGRIVREKEHTSTPMTVDQALYEMELVGHDFYLFSDADCGKPSVVYRRKGFDYGLIQLA